MSIAVVDDTTIILNRNTIQHSDAVELKEAFALVSGVASPAKSRSPVPSSGDDVLWNVANPVPVHPGGVPALSKSCCKM